MGKPLENQENREDVSKFNKDPLRSQMEGKPGPGTGGREIPDLSPGSGKGDWHAHQRPDEVDKDPQHHQ